MTNLVHDDGEMPASVADHLRRKSKIHLDPDLADALDFTEADLEVNRDGVLSERQVVILRRLGRSMTRSWVPLAIVFLVFFLFFVGISIWVLEPVFSPTRLEWIVIQVLALLLLLGMVRVGRVLWFWIPLAILVGEVVLLVFVVASGNWLDDPEWFQIGLGYMVIYLLPPLGALHYGRKIRVMVKLADEDIAAGEVASITGKVHLTWDDAHWLVDVGDESFRIERDTHQLIADKAFYTLYYAPRSGIVLSMEPVV